MHIHIVLIYYFFLHMTRDVLKLQAGCLKYHPVLEQIVSVSIFSSFYTL